MVEKYEQNFEAMTDAFDDRAPSMRNVFVIESFSFVGKIFLTLATPGFFGLVIPQGGPHWPPPANFL